MTPYHENVAYLFSKTKFLKPVDLPNDEFELYWHPLWKLQVSSFLGNHSFVLSLQIRHNFPYIVCGFSRFSLQGKYFKCPTYHCALIFGRASQSLVNSSTVI